MMIRVKHLAGILAFSLALFLVGQNAFSAEKKPTKMPVFEVPTSGKILDVQYRPEFDEWWIKCREGNDIVIYSYDKMTRKWGKVLFTIKKPDEKGKQPEVSQGSETGHPPAETGVGSQKEEKKPEGGKAEGPKKQSDTSQKKTDQKKWWDPLNIIQGGERLIYPGTPPANK